jgi:formylglycine-generating enzyme
MTILDERVESSADTRTTDMVHISGGTFRMGSNDRYPEEAPVHRVTVDGFWIDRTPVTIIQAIDVLLKDEKKE